MPVASTEPHDHNNATVVTGSEYARHVLTPPGGAETQGWRAWNPDGNPRVAQKLAPGVRVVKNSDPEMLALYVHLDSTLFSRLSRDLRSEVNNLGVYFPNTPNAFLVGPDEVQIVSSPFGYIADPEKIKGEIAKFLPEIKAVEVYTNSDGKPVVKLRFHHPNPYKYPMPAVTSDGQVVLGHRDSAMVCARPDLPTLIVEAEKDDYAARILRGVATGQRPVHVLGNFPALQGLAANGIQRDLTSAAVAAANVPTGAVVAVDWDFVSGDNALVERVAELARAGCQIVGVTRKRRDSALVKEAKRQVFTQVVDVYPGANKGVDTYGRAVLAVGSAPPITFTPR